MPAFCQDTKIQFINTSFENASPFNWEIDSSGTVIIELIYDHERSSINRANQHWHFQVQARPGSDLTFILKNFDNIWNGMKSDPISDRTPCFISTDGKNWTANTVFIPFYDFNVTHSINFSVHNNTNYIVKTYRLV